MAEGVAHNWLRTLVDSATVREARARVESKGRAVARGASGSSTTLLAGAVAAATHRPLLLVVAHLDDADDAIEDLALYQEAGIPLATQRFGALEVLPGESNVSLELLAERLGVVERLNKVKLGRETLDAPLVLVAPVQALMQSVPEPDELARFQMTLHEGLSLPPGELFSWLDRAGYSRVDAIDQPGEFATRGGIVDVYLPSSGGVSIDAGGGVESSSAESQAREGLGLGGAGEPIAIRLDYFGDEIESIHLVNTDTMGSGPKLLQVQVIGASVDRLQSDDRTTTLLRMLLPDTIVVLNEVLELSEQARGYYERLTDARGIYGPDAVLLKLTEMPHVQVNQYSAARAGEDVIPVPVQPLPSFAQEAAQAVEELAELANTGEQQVIVLCQQPAERDRLIELIREHVPDALEKMTIEVGYLHRGFGWKGERDEETKRRRDEVGHENGALRLSVSSSPSLSNFLLIPHHELFHRYHTRRRIRRVSASIIGTGDTGAFFDVEPGDFVVHVDHGVARFRGLKTMRRKGRQEDYLTLEFAKGALLHVPATESDAVQKYVGGFAGKPPLSMLGGKRWQNQKEAASEAAEQLATQMLQIQAARAALPGVRYPADTAWQREFEAEFPFEETPDQLAAIASIKHDMADEQPMDRLICGDVGFGKTEVAIRAAFKAVEYGKQVAVLVPTTVLAEQHERTFRERMADYPFRVESISRFKTAGQQKKLLEELAKGRVDIIIGTHRLLSKDVKFADLGVVIIDEEQRFGVEHKQKLLQFRLTADVLTLSATPIPRTLHMAMLGLRDISSLSTAPVDRRAIVTEVVPYSKERIKQGLIRELNRDGQVFFVHNRVHNIQSVADDIHQLVPEARIVIGHGQMSPRELEAVMLQFMRREADVLVSTTIIESGIDIPTANTMFINNADHFGLAELHQLRGRVGRYKHRAYCYLMLPQDRPITDIAARRLKAIEQYAMLGAGFKIAMRDLEIRGAGNLLGAEQSGHIAAVGYEMYCTLLEQAASKMRDPHGREPVKTHMELPVVGRIPASYIASAKRRMEAYKRLARAKSLPEVDAVERDLRDAYGDPPDVVRHLLDVTEIRVAAGIHGIEAMKLEGPDIIFRSGQMTRVGPLLADVPGRATVIDQNTVYWRPPANFLEPIDTLLAVLRKVVVRPVRVGVAETIA